MANSLIIVLCFLVSVSITNVLGQCEMCAPNQGCCMGRMHGQWNCCGGRVLTSENQESTPWNFDLQIKYDVYVWDCSPSTVDPAQQYTNVSCLLDGRWSLNRLTFQLRTLPSNELKTIPVQYTMKNSQPQQVAFEADSQWALSVSVDKNEKAGIYDKVEFKYGGFNYTYYFGYGPYPHCPRC